MTPAVAVVRKHKVDYQLHEYAHEASSASYGQEAAEKLGLDESKVFKTLVVSLDDGLGVGVIPVSSQLSMKAIAQAAGSKKAKMADAALVQRATGYVLGGVSPLGQKKLLPTFIDASAQRLAKIYISAGRRGLDMSLKPQDLQTLTSAKFIDLQAKIILRNL